MPHHLHSKPNSSSHPLESNTIFQETLINWFNTNGHNYPWRQTNDPWEILVSEVMLQQTTIASVIANSRFEKFLKRFPDIESIAAAAENDLLIAWEGLGYYNRVRNLQKTAIHVITHHNGIFPNTLDELKKLPGIGPYTAAALMSFAFNKRAPLVDGNVYRLFSRLFDDPTPIDTTAGQKTYWAYAEKLAPIHECRSYNSALMEIGQRYCLKGTPLCHECPLNLFCQCKTPSLYPIKIKKVSIIDKKEQALFQTNEQGKLMLELQKGSRRKGFWQLPRIQTQEINDHGMSFLKKSVYHITKYRVELTVYGCDSSVKTAEDYRFFDIEALNEIPISTPERRLIDELLAS